LDSILLDKERNAVGKIFEVFGPVVEPLYSIRFNSEEEVSKLPIGMELFYAPKMDELTKRIFADDLLKYDFCGAG
jgi:H/ACA ribonucleoprotein complex non-core subunit NAF1